MSIQCKIAIEFHTQGHEIFINYNFNCRRLQFDEIFVDSDSSNESVDRLPKIVPPPTIINNLQTNSQPSNDDNNSSTSGNIDPSSQGVNAVQQNMHSHMEIQAKKEICLVVSWIGPKPLFDLSCVQLH